MQQKWRVRKFGPIRWALAALLLSAAAAPVLPPEVRTLGAGATSPPASIEDVSFLAGPWTGEGLGGCAEEVMAPASGGQIMGMFRQMKPEGGLRFYEFYTFSEEGGSLVLRIKHFNPDLTGWEEKDERAEFPLAAIEGTTAYFDGITYSRRGKKEFASAVNIEGEGVAAFSMRKAKAGEACASAASP